MITIDNITSSQTGSPPLNFNHQVSSSDAVLVVLTASSTNPTGVTFNGVSLLNLATNNNANGCVDIWYLVNPPVGIYTVSVAGLTVMSVDALTLLGVNKKDLTPTTAIGAFTGAAPSVSFNVPSANSFVLDIVCTVSGAPGPPTPPQTQFLNRTNTLGVGASYNTFSPGTQTMSWQTGSLSGSQAVVIFEPDQAASIWYPLKSSLDLSDIVQVNGLDTKTTLLGQWGNFSHSFYKNSFLHTVGRRFWDPPFQSPPQLLGSNLGSIIIDQISTSVQNNGTSSFSHSVSSQDAILIVVVAQNGRAGSRAQFNGVDMVLAAGNQAVGGSFEADIYYMLNPPVGTYTVSASGGGNQFKPVAITLLGIDKSFAVARGTTTFGASGSPSLATNVPFANGFILDLAVSSSANLTPDMSQQLAVDSVDGQVSLGISFKTAYGSQQMAWTQVSGQWAQSIAIFKPLHATSISYPAINLRNSLDLIEEYALNTSKLPLATAAFTYGNYPSLFYQNSFLHTIGKFAGTIPSTVVSITPGEVEAPTSQIIIDKVYQGQVVGSGIAAGVLNMEINIPSSDAVLVVTGGNVVATGAPFASVQFNGTPMAQLVLAAVAGASSEIWYMPNPPVGTYTLNIVGGNTTAEVYANAMVILGVDKSNTNIISASATDAASTTTIAAQVTPDAGNVLIIDALATLNATAPPIPDLSQTQVFNATALASNEYVLSTFKMGDNSPQTMNYNLSVAANAALSVIALRPAHAPSIWFPNIDTRTLDDVVTVSGLDSSINPAFGQYGYKGTQFYKNSFLHTIGRMFSGKVGTTTSSRSSLLMMMGVG